MNMTMKRLIIGAMLMIASLAGVAQQNNTDDFRSILGKYTLRGYKAFYEVGYGAPLYDDKYAGDLFEIGTSQGFQFNNSVYLGGGVSFNNYFSDGTTYLEVPVFVDFRWNIINKKVTPYLNPRVGYGLGDMRGGFVKATIGARFSLKNRHALNVGISYSAQIDNHENECKDQSNIGITAGFEF